jgi:hypothetical protein
MAPNLFYQYNTLRLNRPTRVYGATYTDYDYYEDDTLATTYDINHNYDTSYTSITVIYANTQIEKKVKRLLKKMADEMCEAGWIHHAPKYLEPKTIPISLRGVRFDGRGWGNKK